MKIISNRLFKTMICVALAGAVVSTVARPVDVFAKTKKAKAAKKVVIVLDQGHDTTNHVCTYG